MIFKKNYMLLVLGILSYFSSSCLSQDWWLAEWKYRQRVTIQSDKISENLIDFPLGLRLKDADFARTLCKPDGEDLRIVDQEGRVLDCEIVGWEPDSVEIYVKIPRIYAGKSDQYVDLYFGNPQAKTIPVKKIWNSDYSLVLHLHKNLEDAQGRLLTVERHGFVVQNGWTPGLIMADSNPWVTFDRQYNRKGMLKVDPEIFKDIDTGFSLLIHFRVKPEQESVEKTLFSALADDGQSGFDLKVKYSSIYLEGKNKRQDIEPLATEGVTENQWHTVALSIDARDPLRMICLDGTEVVSDKAGFLPAKFKAMQIGRSFSAPDGAQFTGDIDEVRISSVSRTDVRMVVETLNLSEANYLVQVGPLEWKNPAEHVLPPVELISPPDEAQSHKKDGIDLQWRHSLGAHHYEVLIYTDKEATQLLKRFKADDHNYLRLTAEQVAVEQVYWAVAARSGSGANSISKLRRLSFYTWEKGVADQITQNKCRPIFKTADHLELNMRGYLAGRLNRMARYLAIMPESNPALLQMLRDRKRGQPRSTLVSWAGVFPGQVLSSAELIWRITRDEQLKQAVDAYVREFIATQEDNGYIGHTYGLEHSGLELWASYAAMHGLLMYFEDTGYGPALDACRKIADLVIQVYGPDGKAIPRSGGANQSISHTMALLYRKTGQQRYLDMVRYMIHQVWHEKGGVNYFNVGRNHQGLSEFPVRRWEGIHNMSTLAEMYWLTGNVEYRAAFEHIWRTLLQTERHNTGGFSTNEGLLGTPYNHGTIETCCTVAWLIVSLDMLKITGDSRIADEMEWSTFNSALSSIPYSGCASSYSNQMNGYRRYNGEINGQGPNCGPDLNCCSTNACRGPGLISQWALMQGEQGLYLNYYGPGIMSAQLNSENRITLEQITDYPISNQIILKMKPQKEETFDLRLRIPYWSKDTVVKLNSKKIDNVIPGRYLSIKRHWRDGDTIKIDLDFGLRFWAGEDECANQISVYRGPLLLACDRRFNSIHPDSLASLNCKDLTFKLIKREGFMQSWILGSLIDSDGNEFVVCDYSSAGQTGNYYRSWFDIYELPDLDRRFYNECSVRWGTS